MSQRVILLVGTIKGLFIFESDINRQEWQVPRPLAERLGSLQRVGR